MSQSPGDWKFKIKVSVGWFPIQDWIECLFVSSSLLLVAIRPWPSLACSCSHSMSASVILWCSFSLCVSFFFLQEHQAHWIKGPLYFCVTSSLLNWLHMPPNKGHVLRFWRWGLPCIFGKHNLIRNRGRKVMCLEQVRGSQTRASDYSVWLFKGLLKSRLKLHVPLAWPEDSDLESMRICLEFLWYDHWAGNFHSEEACWKWMFYWCFAEHSG